MQEESKPSIYDEDAALSTEEAADLAAELKTQLKPQNIDYFSRFMNWFSELGESSNG